MTAPIASPMYRTDALAALGHPEITFVFSQPVPVPNIENFLLAFFERSVAAGVKYEADQRIDMGGSLLRVFARGDGTLGVRDVGSDGNDAEPESVHRALMRTWCRQEVARSFGLLPEFPAPNHTGMLCTQAEAAPHALFLKRRTPTSVDDSGWLIACTDPSHDHDAEGNMRPMYLLHIADLFPWLDQFFALPTRTGVAVEAGDRVSVPVLWLGEGEDPIAPAPSSYVAALNRSAL